MQVTIRDVQVEWGGKPPKKWGKAIVKYDYNGSARSQNVMSFSNPEVFKKVQELVGQTVEVEVGKNDKDFTEWRSISVINAAAPSQSNNASTGGAKNSNTYQPRDYETKEERAARQKLIVKQSSISSAVAVLSPGAKGALDPDAVLKLANDFYHWVMEDDKPASIEDPSADFPF